MKYITQGNAWPKSGRHILAKYDSATISVYQAFNDYIADFAVSHQYFGNYFSYSRMSWIKPNFLWMMYRSGWANKEGQERILEIQLHRSFFDSLLSQAVVSTYSSCENITKELWQEKINNSDVRLQWDPDHDPYGKPLERRALQLGLRGKVLDEYGKSQIIKVIDITDFVHSQKKNLDTAIDLLELPEEKVYIPSDNSICKNIGLDSL
jgi:hypothetical protein